MIGKTIFHHGARVSIIDNSDKAMDAHGHNCGSEVVELTEKHMQALNVGKCIAIDDGEYVTFLVMARGE